MINIRKTIISLRSWKIIFSHFTYILGVNNDEYVGTVLHEITCTFN